MLKLYQSNRTEQLSDLLCVILREPLPTPFEQELIVVPHMGMARWLTLRLADANGICANTNFLLPAGFIWRMLNRLFYRETDANPFDQEYLKWRIYRRLTDVRTSAKDGGALENYLSHGDELDLFQLSRKIAECYDQYLVFRPDWIVRWESSRQALDGDEWQARLWRRLTVEIGEEHWVGLQHRLMKADDSGRLDISTLPRRVILFGIPSLSPAYIQILDRLSRHIDLHCFLINPCRAHWSDIVRPSEKSRRELSAGSEGLYLDVGNPLLASLGVQGRDFFAQLLQIDPGTVDLFSGNDGRSSLLQTIQQDILDLSGNEESNEQHRKIKSSDRSLQIHACHSPMRELEVLKDRLLDLFDADESLCADDVLVMVPDMERYAPFIEFVFQESGEGPPIPFNLSGRGVAAAHPLIDAFLSLLRLPGGRFDTESIVALLEVPAIRRRFGLGDDELGRIVEWIESSGIRWGKNGASRQLLGLPPTNQNSWEAGIDRLLLGFALPGGEGSIFKGVVPCDSVEGTDSRLLEGLVVFTESLFAAVDRLQQPRTLADWSTEFAGLIDQFLSPRGEEEQQVRWLREMISNLEETAMATEYSGLVGLQVIHHHCAVTLETQQIDGRLGSAGITFSTLAAMRSVPFRVICLLGLDDGRFPRNPSRSGFDLMAADFRQGDRSLRIDDRYLFLETLVSARQTLYLSFVGQDIRDNEPLPPSILISELIDYLDGAFIFEDGTRIADRLPIRHPLQPFNKRYFRGNSKLFSYSNALCRAATASAASRTSPLPFIKEPLTQPDDIWREITVDQLQRFFRNPTRYLLRERLGISVEKRGALLENREPFQLDRFESSRILRRLVNARLSGEAEEGVLAEERAAGSLPHGEMGVRLFRSLGQSARNLCERLGGFSMASTEETADIDLSYDDLHLTGRLPRPAQGGLSGFSVEPFSAVKQLGIWIDHLALNAALPNERIETRWMFADALLTFRAPDVPGELLKRLMQIYMEGISRPIHLFPRSASTFVEKRMAGKPPDACIKAAEQRWIGSEFAFGEGQDDHYRLAFPQMDVLDQEFQQLSNAVFEPLFTHRELS